MLDRIMRSLGYVPLVILTDTHKHTVELDMNLAAADLEISRLRKDAERATRHHNEIVNAKNATIADLQEACKNHEKITKNVARLVSVYVFADKGAKEVRLMLAGISKSGDSLALPIRKLMLSKKNSDQLAQEADVIAAGFGVPNTSVPSLT